MTHALSVLDPGECLHSFTVIACLVAGLGPVRAPSAISLNLDLRRLVGDDLRDAFVIRYLPVPQMCLLR